MEMSDVLELAFYSFIFDQVIFNKNYDNTGDR